MRALGRLLWLLLLSLLLVVLAIFAVDNLNAVPFAFAGQVFSANLWWVILGCAGIGFALATLLMAPSLVTQAWYVRAARRERNAIQEDLTMLRQRHAGLQAERDTLQAERDHLRTRLAQILRSASQEPAAPVAETVLESEMTAPEALAVDIPVDEGTADQIETDYVDADQIDANQIAANQIDVSDTPDRSRSVPARRQSLVVSPATDARDETVLVQAPQPWVTPGASTPGASEEETAGDVEEAERERDINALIPLPRGERAASGWVPVKRTDVVTPSGSTGPHDPDIIVTESTTSEQRHTRREPRASAS